MYQIENGIHGDNMIGATALMKALKEEGVEVMFGIPGGVVLPIFDAIYDSDIKFILTRHEQGAIHAADGYARATGKPGVCIATSGPGATNLVTGLANAYMDSIPLIAITGQVNTTHIGKDAFQEADITGISLPITKHNYLVSEADSLMRIVKEAFHIATTGRPGPVLIDIPGDIATTDMDFQPVKEARLKGYNPTMMGHKKQIKTAADAIAKSLKPILYIGGGIISSAAEKELLELAELLQCPVANTLMGKGAFNETHPLSLGMLGMHGTWPANTAISNADVVIAVGVRFDDRVTGRLEVFAQDAFIVHIDVDPAEIGKNVRVDVPIVGDAKNCLQSLIKEIPRDYKPKANWLETITGWKATHPLTYDKNSSELMPQYVIEKLYEATGGKAIITTEVGQNQMWAAQFYTIERPRTFISSGGLGTMGFGFPAAIGAQLGMPDSLVVDIAGDGSFMMNIQELATAVAYGIPVKVIVLNNGYLGMVRQWQQMFYNSRYSASDISSNPSFAKIAEAFGAVGITVNTKEEVEPALKEAMSNGLPTVVDCKVSREANVMPMVPKGAALNEMIENC